MERHREISMPWFTPQMVITAGAGSDTSQDPGTPSRSPMWVEGTQVLSLSSAFPVPFSRELNQKWSIQDLNEHFDMGCLHHKWQLNSLCTMLTLKIQISLSADMTLKESQILQHVGFGFSNQGCTTYRRFKVNSQQVLQKKKADTFT